MFGDFIRSLTAPDPAPLGETDARLALTALLVRLARADGDYANIEISTIDQVISERYGLSVEDTRQVRAEAETLEEEAPDTVRFTRAIKEAVPYEDRESVIEAMWKVGLADGSRDQLEDRLVRLVAPMLGVNDRDSARARQRATRKE